MEFKFKRKYTFLFLVALALHALVLSYYFLFPHVLSIKSYDKETITLLLLANVELILFFYLGLFRKKYFAYHDKLIVKRSLLVDIHLFYEKITAIRENKNDSVLLGFGRQPSFTVYYTCIKNNKRKKITIRTNNNELLLKVLKNEMNIAKVNNIK